MAELYLRYQVAVLGRQTSRVGTLRNRPSWREADSELAMAERYNGTNSPADSLWPGGAVRRRRLEMGHTTCDWLELLELLLHARGGLDAAHTAAVASAARSKRS